MAKQETLNTKWFICHVVWFTWPLQPQLHCLYKHTDFTISWSSSSPTRYTDQEVNSWVVRAPAIKCQRSVYFFLPGVKMVSDNSGCWRRKDSMGEEMGTMKKLAVINVVFHTLRPHLDLWFWYSGTQESDEKESTEHKRKMNKNYNESLKLKKRKFHFLVNPKKIKHVKSPKRKFQDRHNNHLNHHWNLILIFSGFLHTM